MKGISRFGVTIALGALLVALTGCTQPHDGPGETAGKQLDDAMEGAGRQIEKAGDSIQDTARGN